MYLWNDGRAHMPGHDDYVYEGEPFQFRLVPGVDADVKRHYDCQVLPRIDIWCDTATYHACTHLSRDAKKHFDTQVVPGIRRSSYK